MIKKQCMNLYALAQEQFKLITKDIKKHSELERLISEQIWDEDNKGRIKPHFIKPSKKEIELYRKMSVRKRLIYVACMSKLFTNQELALDLGMHENTIRNIFNQVRQELQT